MRKRSNPTWQQAAWLAFPLGLGLLMLRSRKSADEPFGINNISAVNSQNTTVAESRYRQAKDIAAMGNRWVFYWQDIEAAQGRLDYTPQDIAATADAGRGIHTEAVLLGVPTWASTGNSAIDPPIGLYEAIFSDGTDQPGAGKGINPANPWARFVNQTVRRFANRIETWEIWNEPDYRPSGASGGFGFWKGTADDYYRLLKVAYLAAKQADARCTILMGGMAYWPEIVQLGASPFNFVRQVLTKIRQDQQGPASNYFFDATAWHWYSRASQCYDKTLEVRQMLTGFGFGDRPIWINEAGMPIWQGAPYFGSGTETEQASFAMQAACYSMAADAKRFLYFQQYDDGNGERYGLIGNDGRERPSYAAYGIAAKLLAGAQVTLSQQNGATLVEAVTKNQRAVLAWANGSGGTSVTVPAWANGAQLIDQPTIDSLDGISQFVAPSGGQYALSLPGATCNNGAWAGDYIVGGLVRAIVERF